jgi:hypothetical protein
MNNFNEASAGTTWGASPHGRAERLRRVAAGLIVAAGLAAGGTSTAQAASPEYPLKEEPSGSRSCVYDGITVAHGATIIVPNAIYTCLNGKLIRTILAPR